MSWHIIPIGDLKEHEESEDCWCKPEIDDEYVELIYIHNSMDGREEYESGKRKPH